MHEKNHEQLQADALRLRHLALQLGVQLEGQCHSKQEAHEVMRLLAELIEWQYIEVQPALRVVG